MRCRLLLGILIVSLLLTACAKEGEVCRTAADCKARNPQAFTAECIDRTCVYNPIPNVIGNSVCDSGETKCTAPQDCGQCSGNVPGSQYLTQSCYQDQCLADIMPAKVKPVYLSSEARSGGNTFRVQTTYNNPFNLKKDLFRIQVALTQSAASQHRIISAELNGITADRRTVLLASKDINKPIWPGQSLTEDLILEYPTTELEGELRTLTLTIRYSYSTQTTSRESTFQVRYPSNFIYVNPNVQYPCPPSCDDGNRGTRDYCGPETNHFCKHDPLPGVCGNYICETGETQCSCPQDCGPCMGSVGTFVELTCRGSSCVGVLKPGMRQEPNSLFDERRLGPMQLTNTYTFNNPFNTAHDVFALNFDVYSMGDAQDLTIETIRLLDGSQIIAEQDVNQHISDTLSVEVSVPAQAQHETERNVNLGVWYRYTRADKQTRANYNKNLGRITFITLEP